MYSEEPNIIVLSKRESPLVIGLGNGKNFAASDIPAFLDYTKEVVILHDNDLATLSATSLSIESRGRTIERKPTKVLWSAEMAQKGGYSHFMLKEIHEQPTAIRNTIQA